MQIGGYVSKFYRKLFKVCIGKTPVSTSNANEASLDSLEKGQVQNPPLHYRTLKVCLLADYAASYGS